MKTWAGPTIITVASLLAAVALIWHGEDIATVGAILAAVGVFLDNRFRMSSQDDTLKVISENVNGKLDKRIEDGVVRAINKMVVDSKPATTDPDKEV